MQRRHDVTVRYCAITHVQFTPVVVSVNISSITCSDHSTGLIASLLCCLFTRILVEPNPRILTKQNVLALMVMYLKNSNYEVQIYALKSLHYLCKLGE